MPSSVVFVDSGIGGLPYYRETKKYLPDIDYIYIADNGFFPYGDKDESSIRERLFDLVTQIKQQFDPLAIVLACNSASVSALSFLREKFDISFIGVVPAVKPAAQTTKTGRIGVLATQKTVDAPYLANLISDHASTCETFCQAAGDIVNYVEEKMVSQTDNSYLRGVIEPIIKDFKEKGVDTIVLGCTHFLHVESFIKELAGNDILVIDSAEGVARQVIRVVSEKSVVSKVPLSVLYVTSQEKSVPYLQFSADFGLQYKGIFPV